MQERQGQMKFYAVIDTNVFVSALLAKREDSPPVTVMEKLFDSTVIPVFSKAVLKEYCDVLHRAKFGFDPATVDEFLQDIAQKGILLEPGQMDIVLPDMNDVPFYAVTLAHGDDETYLVTGNLKHFPVKPFIVTPAQFLEIIRHTPTP